MTRNKETEKIHIAIVGRQNVGKSKLINCIANQEICIVNDHPGTTTDPISKEIELLPFGLVVIVDTAGIDSEEDFAKKIITKTIKAISTADFAIVVLDARSGLTKTETDLITLLRKIEVSFLVAVNKIEFGINQNLLTELEALEVTHFEISCKENAGIEYFRKKLIHQLPGEKKEDHLKDIACKGDFILFVVPDDYEMLNGRIIETHIKTIREILPKETRNIIVNESDLQDKLRQLKKPPDLIITDCLSAERVAPFVSESIKLTTYSLIINSVRGMNYELIKNVKKVSALENGDKVLISEACDSHLQRYDLGKIKISSLLNAHTNKKLQIDFSNGSGFPTNISDYKLIIHCDGCQLSGKILQSKIKQAKLLDIPITDFSTLISFLNNTYQRTYIPFSDQVTSTEV